MYFHASQVPDIKVLEPRISNHNTPLIYFSTKRENVLVYLSNAVEKHCKDTGFVHNGKWHKWASYGFDDDGILVFDEYYKGALEDTYSGVTGYIYCVENICENELSDKINNVITSTIPVEICGFEIIEDAYLEMLKAADSGLIRIRRYEDLSEGMLHWIEKTIKKEYENAVNEPDYRYFLEAKFQFLKK